MPYNFLGTFYILYTMFTLNLNPSITFFFLLTYSQVTIFVDSLTCHLVSVLVPAVGSIKKSSPSYLLLGHTDFFCEVNSHWLD